MEGRKGRHAHRAGARAHRESAAQPKARVHGGREESARVRRDLQERQRSGRAAHARRQTGGRALRAESRRERVRPAGLRDPHRRSHAGIDRSRTRAAAGERTPPRRRAAGAARFHERSRERALPAARARGGAQSRGHAARRHRRPDRDLSRSHARDGDRRERDPAGRFRVHAARVRRRRDGHGGEDARTHRDPELQRVDGARLGVSRFEHPLGDGRAAAHWRAARGFDRHGARRSGARVQRRRPAAPQTLRAAGGDRDRECAAVHECRPSEAILRGRRRDEPRRDRHARHEGRHRAAQSRLRARVRLDARRSAGQESRQSHHRRPKRCSRRRTTRAWPRARRRAASANASGRTARSSTSNCSACPSW